MPSSHPPAGVFIPLDTCTLLLVLLVAVLFWHLFLRRYRKPAAGKEAGYGPGGRAAAAAAGNDEALLLKDTADGRPDVDGPEDLAEWALARVLESERQSLRVYTRARRGELSFRCEAVVDSTVVELLSMGRETDLIPTWVSLCTSAGVTRVNSPLDVLAYVAFAFWPLPLPPLVVCVRATLHDRMVPECMDPNRMAPERMAPAERIAKATEHFAKGVYCQGGGHVLVRLSSPSAHPGGPPFEYDALPAAVRDAAEMPVTEASIRLYPKKEIHAPAVGSAAAGAATTGAVEPQTAVEATVRFDMSLAAFLGPARHLQPPGWLVGLLTSVMVPGVWSAFLRLQARIRQGIGTGGGGLELDARVATDETGVYRLVQHMTGQKGGLRPLARPLMGTDAEDRALKEESLKRAVAPRVAPRLDMSPFARCLQCW